MQQISLTLFAIIGICLATMFFGYFFGLFEGRGQGYKRRKKEEALEDLNKPPEVPKSLPPVPAPRDDFLLKLSQLPTGQPRLDLDGKPVDTSMLTVEQRKRLIDLMVMMRPWIEAKPVASPAQPAPAPMQQPAAAATAAPVQPPAAAPATPADAKPAPTSMVGQIDVILQKSLIGTPLAGRGIRLTESPEGGVIVMLGTNKYQSVGDVPDPQVQSVIKAAIAEWEKKYTPS